MKQAFRGWKPERCRGYQSGMIYGFPAVPRRRRGTLLCLSVLCVLPVALQWPDWLGWLSQNPIYSFFSSMSNGGANSLLFGAPWVDGSAGNTMQALGRGVVRAWWHGRIPWWNHDAGVGMPLAAAMQPGAFFLPFIMLLGLFDGLVLLKISMQAIAGIATYGLLRTLGLGRWASCLGGVLFQLSGIFAFFRMRRSCRHHSSLCCCWQLKDVCNEQRRA